MVYPYFVGMSEEMSNASFVKVMGDAGTEWRGLMKEWEVKAVPEFRFYKGGELVHKFTGSSPNKLKEQLEAYI